jgi:hypothetical protein
MNAKSPEQAVVYSLSFLAVTLKTINCIQTTKLSHEDINAVFKALSMAGVLGAASCRY